MGKLSVDELRDVASASTAKGSGTGLSVGLVATVFGGVFVAVLAGGLGWSAAKGLLERPTTLTAPQVARVVPDAAPSFDVTGGKCFRQAQAAMQRELKANPGMQMRMAVGDFTGGFGTRVEVEADTIQCAAKATGSFCDRTYRRKFALYVKDFERGLRRNGTAKMSIASAMNSQVRNELNYARSHFNGSAVDRVQGTVASLMKRGLLRPDDFGGMLVPIPEWAEALAPDVTPQRAC